MTKAPMKITKDLSLPEAAGKYIRVICMTGKNKGLCYYLNGPRVVMGRSPQTEIQVLDNQASREHVELVKVGNDYVLTDLGSQNGVVVNDLDVKQHKLKNGDKIIIGSTVFKYSYMEVVQDNLPANISNEDDDEDDDEESEVVNSKGKLTKSKTKKTQLTKPAQKRSMIIYLVVALVFIMFLLPESDEGESKKTAETAKSGAGVFIESGKKTTTKRTVLEKEIEDKVVAYIHRGRREAREANYFRAMEEFSLALMLDPNSGDAAFHMNRAKQRLDEQIESLFLQATKYKDSLKFHQAMMTYCSVVKLLREYQDDERYKEAVKNVTDMASKLNKEQSENQCF